MPVQGPASLVGRLGEQEALRQLVDGVRDGQSAVLVLRGEAGIGKTALLRYLIGQATGFTVARATGVESEMELAFAGLHQLCAPMLGRLGSLAAPQRRGLSVAFGLAAGDNPDRFLVALAALSLMAETSEKRPLLCVVDDAQWLDRASAQVLGFVGRRLLAESVALVFAAREPDAELAGLPELQIGGLRAEHARALLATVVPGPLDESVSTRIIEETRGNPLALLELYRHLGPAELAGGFALPHAGDLPRRIENQYIERAGELPPDTRRMILLAAADPVGDTALVFRAARVLGLGAGAVNPAVTAGLLSVGAHVRFRHPLVRSAVYRAATARNRRAAHGALAAATDAGTDPDRRAWHRAHATTGPDETVAGELIGSAGRALRRGGVAAAAAFWERAVVLTPDPGERAERALAAAGAKYAAGDFEAAQALLAAAEVGPLSELSHALVQRMRAQVAFALRRGSDAPPLLLRAARRLEELDAELARQTYLEALVAAVYVGQLAHEDVTEIARAAGALPTGDGPTGHGPTGEGPLAHARLLVRGLAVRLADGYAAAAPLLREALRRYRARPQELDWLWVAYNMVAMDLWDDQAWSELATAQVRRARANGTLSWLPFALDYLAELQIQAGELASAMALLAEGERIDPGIRAVTLPYVSLLLAAWRGNAPAAAELTETMIQGARDRGEGAALTVAEYARAVLHNGLGDYRVAAEAAERASAAGELVISPWALYELAEAAVRSGQRDQAAQAVRRLSEIAAASGTDWALGAAARSRALLAEGRPGDESTADELYGEALTRLGRTRMATHLARARLCYGEWLRRQNRRTEARSQLRPAYEAFTSMGAQGYAERARRELVATGEKVRKRSEDTPPDLTPQEAEIARLARDGLTNAQIGAQLFIGARTVEWHLRKVFGKLDIGSRRELDEALRRRERAQPAGAGTGTGARESSPFGT